MNFLDSIHHIKDGKQQIIKYYETANSPQPDRLVEPKIMNTSYPHWMKRFITDLKSNFVTETRMPISLHFS